MDFFYSLVSIVPFTAPLCTDLMLATIFFIKSSCTEFHEYWKNASSLVVGHGHTDQPAWFPSKVFFLLREERLNSALQVIVYNLMQVILKSYVLTYW
jgi:hypothetical protein